MPAPQRLNDLDARKRLVLSRADLHREVLTFARDELHGRMDATHEFVERHRWWLIGGALAGGAILARGWRGLNSSALPTILGVLRGFLG